MLWPWPLTFLKSINMWWMAIPDIIHISNLVKIRLLRWSGIRTYWRMCDRMLVTFPYLWPWPLTCQIHWHVINCNTTHHLYPKFGKNRSIGYYGGASLLKVNVEIVVTLTFDLSEIHWHVKNGNTLQHLHLKFCKHPISGYCGRGGNGQTDRQTDRRTDRQTDGQTETERQKQR